MDNLEGVHLPMTSSCSMLQVADVMHEGLKILVHCHSHLSIDEMDVQLQVVSFMCKML